MNQTFDVQGMTCSHCERAVTQAVKALDARHAGGAGHPADTEVEGGSN